MVIAPSLGCLPLLVQLLHSNDEMTSSSEDLQINRRRARGARRRASAAMHNIVHAYVDDKQGRRETRVLRLLEQIRDYCDHLRDVEGLEEEEDEDACPSKTVNLKYILDLKSDRFRPVIGRL